MNTNKTVQPQTPPEAPKHTTAATAAAAKGFGRAIDTTNICSPLGQEAIRVLAANPTLITETRLVSPPFSGSLP